MTEATKRAAGVALMIFDVDGVLTDGQLHYGPDGECVKVFNALDGQGIKFLRQSGIVCAIVSARESRFVARRAQDLGIDHVHQGIHDKRAAFDVLLAQTGLTAEACGFVGDDVIDLPILTRVGFATCPANAHAEVKKRVHYASPQRGGQGVVRDICDLILKAQNRYDALIASYLK